MISVLYVDDEECLLDICKVFLAQLGNISVDTALSVEAGLRLIAGKDYDAIISDYQMPERNGIEFLKTLRSQGNRIPFIIFTGRGREELVIEAFNNGADFFIQKGGETKSQYAELIHKITKAVERRRGEQELENSNSLLKATLESTADGIIVIDSDGIISTLNHKFLQMWNLPANTETLKTEKDFLCHARDQVANFAAFEKSPEEVRYSPESGSYDIIHCCDGRTFRRYSQAQKIGDRIVGRVWSFRDITGQDRAELELRAACEDLAAAKEELKRKYTEQEKSTELLKESEEKYRGVFHAETSPLLLVDRESRGILDSNAAAGALYGYGREEMLRLSLYHLSAETVQTSDEIAGQSPGMQVHFHRKKNATIFPAEISASCCCIGNQPALIVAVRDISRTKQIEDALKLSNVKLNLLLEITRHDILNKLSVLSGYGEILHSRIADPLLCDMLEKQQKTTDSIRKQIDFTREYDHLGIKTPQWYRVDEIAARAYSQILQTITFRCETGNLEIYADPMIEKVVYNLFDNAFRYGEGISRITITCARAGDDLLILFEDDGIGVPEDEKKLIFGRGFGKNTGLGLFLSREILSITGITIRETGEYRKGARFEIRVPDNNYRLLKSISCCSGQPESSAEPLTSD
jgi:PAS domain S-box-containing protein